MANRKKRITDEEFYETFPPGHQPQNGSRFDLQKLRLDYKYKNESQKNLMNLINENKITNEHNPIIMALSLYTCIHFDFCS